jgi:hypothetical protein
MRNVIQLPFRPGSGMVVEAATTSDDQRVLRAFGPAGFNFILGRD